MKTQQELIAEIDRLRELYNSACEISEQRRLEIVGLRKFIEENRKSRSAFIDRIEDLVGSLEQINREIRNGKK